MGKKYLFYFEGRNTAVVAETLEEARRLKKRGGDKLLKKRTPTAEERELIRQGKWVRTRIDGKKPEESRYGKGRGQGPPRK